MEGLEQSSLIALEDLFRRLATAHKGIKGFAYGDEYDLKQWAKQKDAEYPVLFLEMPDEGFVGRNIQSEYDFGFAVFTNLGELDAAPAKFGQRRPIESWALSQKLCRAVLAMLRKMNNEQKLTFDILKSKLLPVSYFPTVDRAVGYRASLTIEYQAPLCVDPADWDEV